MDVNRSASDGTTTLHVAARSGRVDYVGLLLSSGADPMVRDVEREITLAIITRGHGRWMNFGLQDLISMHLRRWRQIPDTTQRSHYLGAKERSWVPWSSKLPPLSPIPRIITKRWGSAAYLNDATKG